MQTEDDIYLYTPKKQIGNTVNVWMAFPGSNAFALSSLGYMWLSKQLEERSDINIERINTETASTAIKPKDVDLAGFSFTFDTDFINVFTILDRFNIPLRSSDRGENTPVVFAGGPVVTANPAPYEAFFDFFIIGDGEVLNEKVVDIYAKSKDKDSFLRKISNIDGIYVPKYKRTVIKSTEKLSECIYTPIISPKAYFSDTFIIEISRGCANRCGFCLASYINLPLRCLPCQNILEAIDLGLGKTDKIALLGAQLSAHPDFEKICEHIFNKHQTENPKIEMSLSSLRVDAVTPKITKILSELGQRNITLAVEAGSERLRKVINKNLTKKQIFNAVDIAQKHGIKGLKLYGMIGLPTEAKNDIEELIELAKEIKTKYKSFDLSFGISTFVPKPHTPFQWYGREDTKSLEKKSQYIQKELHKLGIQASVSSPKWDYWQAVLSRGDSTLSDFLELVYKKGGSLGAYKNAAKELNIDADFFAYRNIPFDETLPWDFLTFKPGKDFLIKENKRLSGKN